MALNKSVDRTLRLVAVLGSLVLVNVIGLSLFGRLDLTRARQFTLSSATRDTLRSLGEPVTVRAYFTSELPPPYAAHARYVKDLLEEYYAAAHGNFRFEFIDPENAETSADKEKKKEVKTDMFGRAVREPTSVERELSDMGIPPVQVRVNADDKVELKRAYMGLVVLQGDKKEAIPVITETAGLEYDLTSAIRKVSRARQAHIGLLVGQGGLDAHTELSRLRSVLGQLYEVSDVSLAQNPNVSADIDALLVIGGKAPFSDNDKHGVDAFLRSGKAAAFFVSSVKVKMQALESEEMSSGLNDLLATYGVEVGPGLLLDAECATITISQQRGFMRVQQPVQYPYMVLPKVLGSEHAVTHGLSGVLFPFMSPVHVTLPETSAVKTEVLASSSADSWAENAPYNLDPFAHREFGADRGKHPMVVALTGPIGATPGAQNAESASQPEARAVVVGGAYLIADQFLNKPNETLLLNIVDWLTRDDALLAVRARGLAVAPLRPLSDGERATVRYLNVIGLPATFVGFGLVRWRRREARRSKVTL